jgi:hypothetical protein
MGRGHPPWRRPDAKRESDVRQPGPVRRLTPAEIAAAYPGQTYKPPVRFGPRR